MILRQFLHSDPVAVSYLFGCGGKASAAVVDPLGYIAPYLEAAEATGMRILHVIDTHIHADHVSAGRARRGGRRGVRPVPRRAGGLPLPGCQGRRHPRARQRGSDGHAHARPTPEHISLLVTDRTRAPEPWFALTGHTLMVGDLGRTELASSAAEGAKALFASVSRLKDLPDHVEVLPGAYSGSVCGRSLSGKPTSTIGFEKRFNKALRIEDEDAFVAAMTADIPPPPPDAARTRAVNAGAA